MERDFWLFSAHIILNHLKVDKWISIYAHEWYVVDMDLVFVAPI